MSLCAIQLHTTINMRWCQTRPTRLKPPPGALVLAFLWACALPSVQAGYHGDGDAIKYSECVDTGSRTVYDYLVPTLDQQNVSLSNFKGSVLMVVNTATF